MIELKNKLPFWFAGPEALKLSASAQAFWARWEAWLGEVAPQADIRVCSAGALALHAADRGVTRLPGEPEALWRDRVLHALLVAIESGSRSGLEAILTAFGLQNFSITERAPEQDWDVVQIDLHPKQLTLDSDRLTQVLCQWGRLCRRYAPTYTMSVAAGLGRRGGA